MKFMDPFNFMSIIHAAFTFLFVMGAWKWITSDIPLAALCGWGAMALYELIGDAFIGYTLKMQVERHYIFDQRGGDWYDIIWNSVGAGLAWWALVNG